MIRLQLLVQEPSSAVKFDNEALIGATHARHRRVRSPELIVERLSAHALAVRFQIGSKNYLGCEHVATLLPLFLRELAGG